MAYGRPNSRNAAWEKRERSTVEEDVVSFSSLEPVYIYISKWEEDATLMWTNCTPLKRPATVRQYSTASSLPNPVACHVAHIDKCVTKGSL